MPRDDSASDYSSSEDSSHYSSEEGLLIAIPRPGVVFGEGSDEDDDPFASPSKVRNTLYTCALMGSAAT
jgi:hypothetical protein